MENVERAMSGNTLPWVIYAKYLLCFLYHHHEPNWIFFFLMEEGLKISFERTFNADKLATSLLTAEDASPP